MNCSHPNAIDAKNSLLVAGLLGLLALQIVSYAEAFTIFPAHHQDMTRQALAPGNYSYQLPNGSVQIFDFAAIQNIEDGNFLIDVYSTESKEYDDNYHFDDERFAIGQKILLSTRDQIILQLSDEAFHNSTTQDLVKQTELSLNSRELLGNALHTLQDYYSHSNWLEQQLLLPGSPRLNLNVGAKGKKMAAPTEAECSDDFPGEAMHTSGDYFASGITDCTFICSARPGKCAHGNVLPNVALLALALKHPECAEIDPDCGLNKDRVFREGHPQAYELAMQHTALFVTKIFDEALQQAGTNESFVAYAICQFMGVPDPLATCTTKHTVKVQKINIANGQPTAQGLVQSTSGNLTPAIDCGLLCEGTAVASTEIELTASDSGNWKFVRWSEGGVCAGSTSPECSFTLTGNLLARPEFKFFNYVSPLYPKASFLRTDPGDPPLNPIIINLNELGIVPGQVIELSSSGFYYVGTTLTDEDRRINMVFSSSNELLPHSELHRVPGAIGTAATGLLTTNTCSSPNPLSTDIPEDFSVASPSFAGGNNPVLVTVPAGAQYLFAGVFDCAYWDNSDPDGDLEITIRYPVN